MRGGPIHAPVPRSEAPQATPTTYGGRRQRREQKKKALQRRRLLVALPILIGLLTGLLFFGLSMERDQVARLEVPTVGSGPEVPTAGSQTGSNPDPRSDPEAASGATRVEAELMEEKTEPLRSELGQIAQAYAATYGVVILDPTSGERVAMNADRRFLAASLNKLPVLMTLYRAAASGEVDLDDKISMQASDVQAYGMGVLYTYPLGHTITLRECARLLIKESDNTAWKILDRCLGRDYIRAELYRVGAFDGVLDPQHHDPGRRPAYAGEDLRSLLHHPRPLGRDARGHDEHFLRRPPSPASPGRDAGLAQDRLLRNHLCRRRNCLPRGRA